jgi:hypothetical protein
MTDTLPGAVYQAQYEVAEDYFDAGGTDQCIGTAKKSLQ